MIFILFLRKIGNDEKLWVTPPGLKFVHPRGASLNNLELLEVVVPVTIVPTVDRHRGRLSRAPATPPGSSRAGSHC